MGLFGYTPPCEQSATRRDQQLSSLLDEPSLGGALGDHVAACERCKASLSLLRADHVGLRGLGDAPGAAPDEAELRRVLAAVSLDRATRRSPLWMAWAAAAATVVVAAGFGARQLLLVRARAADDAAILAGADAAFRRAERDYDQAVAMLRAQLDKRSSGAPGPGMDPRVAEGARSLEQARAHASELVKERRGDPEREALLRDALRAEVRYYEDALMRTGATPEPQP